MLRLANFDTWSDPTDHTVSATSSVVTTAVEGRTYSVIADFHDVESSGWSRYGPQLGFDVDGDLHVGDSSIIGANDAGDFVTSAYSWQATAADAGKPIRVYVDVMGAVSSAGQSRPDALFDNVRVATMD